MLDEYLTADKVAMQSSEPSIQYIQLLETNTMKVDCADNALSTECSDSCTSKRLAALSAISHGYVGVTTSFPKIYLATTDRVRNVRRIIQIPPYLFLLFCYVWGKTNNGTAGGNWRRVQVGKHIHRILDPATSS